MFRTVFHSIDGNKVKNYKSLNRAYKAIFEWFGNHGKDRSAHVLLSGPEIGTETYRAQHEVPYKPKVKTRKLNHGMWVKVRAEVLKRDNYLCVRCGNGPQKNSKRAVEVHHKISVEEINRSVELTYLLYAPSNLETLCDLCHLDETIKQNTSRNSPD
ncbi:HNH endonuclease [Thalassotalea sp. PS06]|uniref:HNH endonuclease n=1 Tax=Thalassotalea sp. PS06 TaxID=2594005 RepID=UPI0011656467|nr:HNH endonuclease [Thalassotalea sp. PS06]QDP01609.1 HNH endonuclease [Thalassotalea sp. PS06]